jgi:hypothetical protein
VPAGTYLSVVVRNANRHIPDAGLVLRIGGGEIDMANPPIAKSGTLGADERRGSPNPLAIRTRVSAAFASGCFVLKDGVDIARRFARWRELEALARRTEKTMAIMTYKTKSSKK